MLFVLFAFSISEMDFNLGFDANIPNEGQNHLGIKLFQNDVFSKDDSLLASLSIASTFSGDK